jgi:hypothetical protein
MSVKFLHLPGTREVEFDPDDVLNNHRSFVIANMTDYPLRFAFDNCRATGMQYERPARRLEFELKAKRYLHGFFILRTVVDPKCRNSQSKAHSPAVITTRMEFVNQEGELEGLEIDFKIRIPRATSCCSKAVIVYEFPGATLELKILKECK